jgi:eukaryotic-like serine/threonine-protein kinase
VADRIPEFSSDERLQSWKEIAAYLRFGVRTLQRWEATEGLPVHRRSQDRRSTVFAFKRELDAWYESRRDSLTEEPESGPPTAPDSSQPDAQNGTAAAPGPTPARRRWPSLLLVFAACLAGFAGFLPFLRQPREMPKTPTFSLSVLPPQGTSFMFGTDAGGLALSLDGRNLAMTLETQGTSSLWVRSLQSQMARPLAGTEGGSHPFWSPDGRVIAFFAGGKLKKVPLTGGAPTVLCDAPLGRGGAWSARGFIVLSPSLGSGLRVIPETGGESRLLTDLDGTLHENSHLWPTFLPGGEVVLYAARTPNPESSAIYASFLNKPKGARKRILNASSNVLYASGGNGRSGYLVFARDRQLWAQPFDPRQLQLLGEPELITDHVGYWANMRLANFSVSDNGILAFASAGSDLTELRWISRDGHVLSRIGNQGLWFSPKLSPDEGSVAIARTESGSGLSRLWIWDSGRNVLTGFTSGQGRDGSPVWSPDGKQIAFLSARGGPFGIYLRDTTGSSTERPMLVGTNSLIPYDWSRDARFLLYGQSAPKTRFDLWVMPLLGEQKPSPLLQTPADELDAQFSPDGRWIAYTSDESGRDEIYLQLMSSRLAQFDSSGRKWQLSNNGGSEARWRGDSRELFYKSTSGLMSVSIEAGTIRAARPLFPLITASQFRGTFSYDVTKDGQRFLALCPIDSLDNTAVSIITNFTAGLQSQR